MVFVRETSSQARKLLGRVASAAFIAFGFLYILFGRLPSVPHFVQFENGNIAHADAPVAGSIGSAGYSCGDSTDCACADSAAGDDADSGGGGGGGGSDSGGS